MNTSCVITLQHPEQDKCGQGALQQSEVALWSKSSTQFRQIFTLDDPTNLLGANCCRDHNFGAKFVHVDGHSCYSTKTIFFAVQAIQFHNEFPGTCGSSQHWCLLKKKCYQCKRRKRQGKNYCIQRHSNTPLDANAFHVKYKNSQPWLAFTASAENSLTGCGCSRPAHHQTPSLARLWWAGDPTRWSLRFVGSAAQKLNGLASCRRDYCSTVEFGTW